jgi:hypothetical protein
VGHGGDAIDGAGHMPHMERPAEVQAAIEEAIAGARDGDRGYWRVWRVSREPRPAVQRS